jgi:N-acetylglucosamine-6-phosphate deacetylase
VLASLVTAPVSALCHQLAVAADLVESGSTNLVGIHLEGPFLSHYRCGAQNPDHLILPNLEDFTKMVDASRGTLAMMTIAPELPGAIELIEACTAAGVVAAVGHTDATYEQAAAAFQAGATVATHLFNGMRPIHHREPGPVLAALDAGAGCEVINDGVHVHPAVLRLVVDRDPAQLVLISDAISATGIGDGSYELGGQQVVVSEGHARLATNGSLAGSTVTMDDAVRRAVTEANLPIEVAVAAASTNPARLMGMAGVRGSIEAGLVADLIHLGADLRPRRIMRNGGWLQAI